MRTFAALLALVAFASVALAVDHTPSLLLSPKLLRRLERDRTRETVRWQNFEKRVLSVPDSPERGFELALYYAVTHDPERGREAINWALAHKSEARQVALVLDWTADLLTPEQSRELSTVRAQNPRDRLFLALATDQFEPSRFETDNQQVLHALKNPSLTDAAELYAAVEYLIAYRAATDIDLRETDAPYFRLLPKILLLNLTPDQVEHPNWTAHLSALALVTLDPNLDNSQFLQGWAMEDSQTLHEGPGVAYELLWGDPYLPGIAYQNMDTWVYDPAGSLFARTDWNRNACWIRISSTALDQQNCDAAQFTQSARFGTLTLLRLTGRCDTLPARKNRDSVIYWKLPPRAQLLYDSERQRLRAQADSAGMWLAPNQSIGKICLLN